MEMAVSVWSWGLNFVIFTMFSYYSVSFVLSVFAFGLFRGSFVVFSLISFVYTILNCMLF
jgi:hypothetical protein